MVTYWKLVVCPLCGIFIHLFDFFCHVPSLLITFRHSPSCSVTLSPVLHAGLTQNGRQPHQKLKRNSPKMKDHLTKNKRRPHPKWTTTSPKFKDDEN